jgi:hypothetical protein
MGVSVGGGLSQVHMDQAGTACDVCVMSTLPPRKIAGK